MSQDSWLSAAGHFSLGVVGFGIFAILFIIFSVDYLKLAPFAVIFVIALAGGISLGLAIHLYLKNRRVVNHHAAKEIFEGKASIDLLAEPNAVSFMSISEGLSIPTTSKLKVPRRQ